MFGRHKQEVKKGSAKKRSSKNATEAGSETESCSR